MELIMDHAHKIYKSFHKISIVGRLESFQVGKHIQGEGDTPQLPGDESAYACDSARPCRISFFLWLFIRVLYLI